MFSSNKEEEAIRGISNYLVPGMGQLPYGGIGSLYNTLEESIRKGDLLIPLYANIIEGDWLFDYILRRLSNKPQFQRLYDNMKEVFSLFREIPRHEIPYFFSHYICNVVNSLRSTLGYGALDLKKTSFNNSLALASYQFFNYVPCDKPEYKV